jgi:hypothetical protein
VPQPALLVAALILLFFALLSLRRAWRLRSLVTALRALSPVGIGEAKPDRLNLVKGRVASPAPIPSAFQGKPSVYYAYRVEDRRADSPKPRRLALGKDWATFELEDATGSAIVESRPALIHAPHLHDEPMGRLEAIPPERTDFFEAAGIYERHLARFQNVHVVEYTLEPGDEVFVVGSVREENGRKVFYRAKHSPLAVSTTPNAGLVPGYRNEQMLFSVASLLLAVFAAAFLVASLA